MTRRPYIAANWKMWGTRAEAAEYCERLPGLLPDSLEAEVVLCAPFTALDTVVKAVEGSDLRVAAQNMHQEESGAFTGEI
jgi:triosephosphate isomerase (TIM)